MGVAGDDMVIAVIDDGPGPPPDLAESLCEPFVTGKDQGVGLGLALARQVAAAHGGALEWSRDEQSELTRFALRVPRSMVARKEAS